MASEHVLSTPARAASCRLPEIGERIWFLLALPGRAAGSFVALSLKMAGTDLPPPIVWFRTHCQLWLAGRPWPLGWTGLLSTERMF